VLGAARNLHMIAAITILACFQAEHSLRYFASSGGTNRLATISDM